jgi:hypothetical protein
MIKLMRAFQDSRDLKANIVFLYEGEEERGSGGFREAIREHKDEFEGLLKIR